MTAIDSKTAKLTALGAAVELCAHCHKPFELNHPPAYWRGLLFHRAPKGQTGCQMAFMMEHANNINHQTGEFNLPAESEQYQGISLVRGGQ